jgi:SP family arabinose:H+ symporter-like MFS transporter
MSAESSRLNRTLLTIALIASLGGLLFGFDTAVIAGTTGALTLHFHLSPALLGVTVSSALWGTVLGAAMGGVVSDRLGRRASLRGLGLLYVVSAVGCAFAWGWIPLLVFRILSGIAVGGSSVISPTYIAEISPASWRGRLVGSFQFNVVFGILLAYLSNYVVAQLVQNATAWRWMFAVAAFPALVFWLALFFIPESPRWLVQKGNAPEALRVLARIGDADPQQDLADIQRSLEQTQGSDNERLFQWRYRLPIFLAISIGMFNQLSGINAILYYLNGIFQSAGFNQVSSSLQAVFIGLTNLVAVTIALTVIDRLGRRRLLLVGSVGTALCLAGVAAIFKLHAGQRGLVWFLIGFVGFFSFSQGAVIWVYISEVFPNSVRAKGQSLGSFTHWSMNALVSVLFPIVAATWISAPFFFFAGMMVLQFIVVLAWYPETRGVRLEAMEDAMHMHA